MRKRSNTQKLASGETLKECRICFVFKPLSEFHKNYKNVDGHQGLCKECQSQVSKVYTIQNREKLQAKKLQYYYENKEVLCKKEKIRHMLNKDSGRQKAALWNKNNPEKRKEILVKANAKYRDANKAHNKAHGIVNRRKRDGTLVPLPCRICSTLPTDAHHSDYSKPLDVMWLCSRHHSAWHRFFIADKLA